MLTTQNLTTMRSAISTSALQPGAGRGGRQQRRQQRHAVAKRVSAIATRDQSPPPPKSPRPSNDSPDGGVSARRPSGRGTTGRGSVVPQSVALPTPPTDEHSTDSVVKSFDFDEGTLYVGMSTNCTTTRPGNGGLRVRSYESAEAAEQEAEALTAAMTLKHAAYNTGFTGAKLVFDAAVPIPTINKEQLMCDVARTLASEEGRVYTGCDINTTEQDMDFLDNISPFVLAGIGSAVDTNIATADGAFAAVVCTARRLGLPSDFSVFVQGAGKVGSSLAASLVEMGATVYTADVVAERADIRGCTNVSHMKDPFRELKIDIFSPNAISGVVTEDVASCLTASAIVGAANVPFLNDTARSIAASRGIKFVPEFITSAGAIIVDSLEWCHEEFTTLRPSVAYAFVYDQVYEKAGAYLKAYDEAPEEDRHRFEEITRSVCEPSDTTKVGSKLREWLTTSTEKVDVVVVGAGMAGTAAAYQLSKQAPELKGVVLEAGDEPAHRKGSSFGASRMFRQMYSDPYFSDLQSKSLGLWKELEEESGSKLLDVNGLLFYGEADTGETVEGSIPGARDVMEKRGLPHEYLDSPEALQQRFPGLEPEKDQYIGLFEQTAGSVNSSLACKEMMRMAEVADWRLQCNAGVKDVWQVPGSSAYHVLTADGKQFVTDKLVVAAGAWTNNVLAHLNTQLDVEVWRVHWGHYKLKEGKQSPQWFHFGKGDALYYGFPGEDGIAKVGVDFSPEHDQGLSMDAFEHDADEELSAKIDAFVQSQWGDVYGERVDMVASPYTMSKDAMFVLDTLPGHPNVSVFSAGNGRAFKFGPMLGKALAALVTGTPPPFDITPMSLRREGICKFTATAAAATTAAETEAATVEDGSDSFGRAHVPYGERGEATYSKLTMGCFDVVQNTADLMQTAVRNLQLPADHVGSVRLADFGSADGGPEMPLMHQVKSWLPAQCDLEVAFEDQPNNDFQSLFALANGLVPLPLEGAKPLIDTPGIFFSGIGRSFFEQCLPRDSVDLCTSFTAMHWLSQFPTALPDSAHHTQSSATQQLALFEKQAASDWRTIMGHRAAELRKGGQGVVASFGVSPEGRYLGWSGEEGSANMYAELNKCWDAMLTEGRITAAEHKEATFCNYYRSEAELRAPFEDGSLGLQLLSLEWRSVTCPFGRGKSTPEDLVGTVRTWSNSTFLSALSEERSPLERSLLVDHLYDSYAQRIAAAPADHHMDYQHAYLHFIKV